jgi:hypothetical protein
MGDQNMDTEFTEEKKEWGQEEEEVVVVPEKKRLCKYVITRRGCDKAERCTFLHPVCAFYVSEQGCTAGTKCQFKHDKDGTPLTQLKPCPNKSCANLCLGKQCMDCHSRMNRERSPKRQERRRTDSPLPRKRSDDRSYRRSEDDAYRRRRQSSSPDHPYRRTHVTRVTRVTRVRVCPEAGCKNTCLGRRCRECHLRSINTAGNSNREYRSDEGGYHEEK